MIIHLIGAGPKSNTLQMIRKSGSESTIIGVDNGAAYLMEEDIHPDAVFGDFDSLSKADLAELKRKVPNVFIFPPEKDYTDLELALEWAISKQPEKIFIHCVTGKRLDHEYGSISLLVKYRKHSIPIYIIDEHNEIYVIGEGTHQIKKQDQFKYISFFSLGTDIENLTLKGFKYPLTNHHLELGSSLCVSNELDDSVGSISFSSGIALVIRSKD
ncbi:thiamine diphosphokinase [Gottfriedia solisilvae]|uniref:Thiamine diphosphokinase n=1 Tax=Gottfriedia solisilvae TaxID=1516104 RepID=A0A8J3AH43_9BACI|nr:thiamine diphosphokinase [Gottfriedia solisilvae]GGI14308.1 thiamine pyrophosphokinase [Gottfriedia solisilvae]